MLTTRELQFALTTATALAVALAPATLSADTFVQTNLVANTSGVAAVTDPNLINPWGVAFTATSPFWISDQGSGVSTLYNGAGTPSALVVTIPGSSTPPSGPTGQVANTTTGFVLGDGKSASFIFDTLNGTIAAWNGGEGTAAVTVASTPGAIYTGLALAADGASTYIYAADSTGAIRVFDSSFNPVVLSGGFVDPNAIAGYVPFNIQLIGSTLYVTYAQLGPHGTALPGGYVDEFDTAGDFIGRFATGGALEAPWGITLAPATFGSFGDDLLIGNFGNGEIDAYSTAGTFEGTLDGAGGTPLVNDNLWALDFRTGGTGVNPNALYLTAGIDNQQGGLFAEIAPSTPEPAPLILVAYGIAALALTRLRGRLVRRA